MSALDDAEQFKRLFIDPAVQAIGERMEAHLKPITDKQELQQKQIDGHATDIAKLKSENKKAMWGWGVYATGLALTLSSVWGWIRTHFKIGFGG